MEITLNGVTKATMIGINIFVDLLTFAIPLVRPSRKLAISLQVSGDTPGESVSVHDLTQSEHNARTLYVYALDYYTPIQRNTL